MYYMCMHVYSLPTRPHRWQIAGQRETHTYTSLPTRLHRWQIAGQGETHTYTHPCLPDRTDGRSPVRERHTVHTSLPTRPHRWQIAGQGETHTYTHPCLPDRTDGRSPVRETHTRTHIPAYQTAQMADRQSGRDTHTHIPAGSTAKNGRNLCLSCSLSLAFLAEVTGRGYQREGFSGFLRALTVTIARSVDCECPISAATSDSLRSSSVRAIALSYRAQTGQFSSRIKCKERAWNQVTGVSVGKLIAQSERDSANRGRAKRVRGRGGDRAFTVNRTGDSPFFDCDCP